MNRVLIIEDNQTMRDGMEQTLIKSGYEVMTCNNGRKGVEQAKQLLPHCVITDLKMDGMDGIEVLRAIKQIDPETAVMVISAYGSIELAVDAMKLGAFDFLTKPFPPELLRLKVSQALEHVELNSERDRLFYENAYLRLQDDDRYDFEGMVGQSKCMQSIFAQIRKVAGTDSSVFLTGESGTGKELVARAIHRFGRRREGPFIKVNCSALAEGVLESELFGHERGAFTGAVGRKPGRFELADGGTLFLDEIGDISPAIQLKLLRVLQEREFERVGGTTTIKVDVRVISATNQDLIKLVEQGSFREDLYYRLFIVPISLPPLRERRDDIESLAKQHLGKLEQQYGRGAKRLSNAVLTIFHDYHWPGNVRELQNLLEQAYVMCEGEAIDPQDLPDTLRRQPAIDKMDITLGERTLPEVLESTERQLIEDAYEKTGGVKAKCARMLGIKTSALYYKLEKYGLIHSAKEQGEV